MNAVLILIAALASAPDAGATTSRSEPGAEPNAANVDVEDPADTGVEAPPPVGEFEVMSILGSQSTRERISGSAHYVDEEFLLDWEYDDVGRVLKLVPGVYVRDEDGFGLRPNIGLRGAASDRSKKVVLMEDGVLFAPAPYSAPAAYFFPLFTRMVGLEVFKGPAAVRHGPNTIGGAVNLLSREVPRETRALLDVAGGQTLYGKAHGAFGTTFDLGSGSLGILAEGVHLRSDGFKELDGGGDTGFGKNEAMLKLRYANDPTSSVYQWLELKALYSDERSNETYLGLTDEDFEANPQRRYFASRDDLMEFQRIALRLTHVVEWGADIEVRTTLYRSDLERTWGRLATLGGAPLMDALYGGDPADIALLAGERDSTGPDDRLGYVTNERVYYSMGAQSALFYRPDWLDWVDQEIELGVRVHQDQVRRFHTDEGLFVDGDALVGDGTEPVVTVHNVDRTTAYSAHLTDRIQWDDLTLTPGLRAESIGWRRRDRLTRATTVDRYEVFLPGIGAYYALTGDLGVLGGVHRGFSPVVPGTLDAAPELSINYELGGRYQDGALRAEIVGFYNDYSNLTNVCSFSAGCSEEELDRQSSAGAVNVYGAEAVVRYDAPLSPSLTLDTGVTYTWTDSEFRDAFDSADPTFGNVDPGEELPYVPTHQAAFDAALQAERWGFNTVVSYVGEMRETADEQDPVFGELRTDAQLIVDVGAELSIVDGGVLYARIDNVFNQQNIVSRRPFGARPGRPFTAFMGFRFEWGGS